MSSKRLFNSFLALVLLLTLVCNQFLNINAVEQIEVNDFAGLKEAIEAGGEKEIILKSDINVLEQVALVTNSKITIKDDGSAKRLIFDESMAVDDSMSYGKGMILVPENAELMLSGSSNENLVFDGNRNQIAKNLDVSDNGLFLTATGSNSLIMINHASFINSKNRGGKTAPILAKDSSRIIINDVLIKDNLYNQNQTYGNYKFRDWDNNTQTAWSAKGSALAIQSGAEIIFNNGIIEHNGIIDNTSYAFSDENINQEIPDYNFHQGAIALFGRNSKITINDGVIRNNYAGVGGSITVANGAIATINGGKFEDNRAILRGGVADVYSSFADVESGRTVMNNGSLVSKLVVNGGVFKSNRAYKMGGGAFFGDWNSNIEINGGLFENNSAVHGGAVIIGDRWRSGTDDGGSEVYIIARQSGYNSYENQWKWHAYATINGGTFIDNKASLTGGAIYINSDHVNLKAAEFKNNQATRFGGAVYVSSVPYKLHLRNAYFENNKAENVDVANVVYNHDGQQVNLYNGSGGALWYCPTGDSEFYVSNSAGFAENSGVRAGDEIVSVTKLTASNAANSNDPDIKNKDFKITIDNRMLGGGKIDWYRDGSGVKDSSTRYQASDKPLSEIKDSKDEFAIKGISLASAQSLAKANANLLFIGNKAGRGGAVASNGSLIIGDKDKEFNLKVIKNWDSQLSDVKDNDNTNVEIELYNVTDPNNASLIDTAILNKANNYEYLFKHLPLEANDKKIKYRVVEKGDTYNVTYENNEFSTDNINNQQEVITTISNSKKEVIPETISVSVTKEWVGVSNDETTPAVNVLLTKKVINNGKEDYVDVDDKTLVLNKDNSYKGSFTELPKFEEDGKTLIEYSVREVVVSGYSSKVTGSMAEGFKITNTKEEVPKPNPKPEPKPDPKPEPKPEPPTPDLNIPIIPASPILPATGIVNEFNTLVMILIIVGISLVVTDFLKNGKRH